MGNTKIKLFNSELKVMEILWEQGDVTALKIIEILAKQISWNRTTTYTVIRKCIEKKAIKRIEPGFLCHALITREQARENETSELINKMYDGSADKLVASLLGCENLTAEDIEQLKKIVNDFKK